MSLAQAPDVRALVLRSSGGDVVSAALQNAKAFRKSLENNELWVYQLEGGRVLPYDIGSAKLQELRDHGTWYEAVVATADTGPTPGAKAPATGALAASPEPADRPEGGSAGGTASGAVLERLAKVISTRRQDMPEGSYTSYLFREGEEKIRKKAGEEAVELILARKTEDIRNEAADLIYHLLVLLEVCDIPIQDVMEVLRGRE